MKYLDDSTEADPPSDLAPYLDREPNEDVSARIDVDSIEMYACGVNAMVTTLVDAVQRIGVPQGHIRAEGYG